MKKDDEPVSIASTPDAFEEIGAMLRRASAAYRLKMERALAEFGVTAPQYVVLGLIDAHADLTGADVARRAALTPQTVSVILANLRRDGHVEVRREKTLGRSMRLCLTESGRTALEQCRARVRAFDEQLLQGLKPKRERAIKAWLAAVGACAERPGAIAQNASQSP